MVTLLLKLVMLLGCPLVLYGISVKNETMMKSDNYKQESLDITVQQSLPTPQEQLASGSDLILDDDFDINSLINAEEDI